MVTQRPNSFSAALPFGSSAGRSQASASPAVSRARQLGLGLGPSRGAGGLGQSFPGRGGIGLAKGGIRRHMKVQRDSIRGISDNEIRRLARRGGVKRISGTVFNDIRQALRDRLAMILKDVCAIIDSSGRKTVSVTDVVFALQRRGAPVYGFDPAFIRERLFGQIQVSHKRLARTNFSQVIAP